MPSQTMTSTSSSATAIQTQTQETLAQLEHKALVTSTATSTQITRSSRLQSRNFCDDLPPTPPNSVTRQGDSRQYGCVIDPVVSILYVLNMLSVQALRTIRTIRSILQPYSLKGQRLSLSCHLVPDYVILSNGERRPRGDQKVQEDREATRRDH